MLRPEQRGPLGVNGARPSRATGTIPDPYDELRKPPSDAWSCRGDPHSWWRAEGLQTRCVRGLEESRLRRGKRNFCLRCDNWSFAVSSYFRYQRPLPAEALRLPSRPDPNCPAYALFPGDVGVSEEPVEALEGLDHGGGRREPIRIRLLRAHPEWIPGSDVRVRRRIGIRTLSGRVRTVSVRLVR
jgi:hypothetical protein